MEFVVLAPLLVLILFGIIVYGISFHRAQGMQAAAREAARLAAVGATADEVATRAQVAGTPTIDGADLVVVVERVTTSGSTVTMTGAQKACDPTVPAADKVKVTVSVADPDEYSLTIPFFGPVTSSYESEAVFKCE